MHRPALRYALGAVALIELAACGAPPPDTLGPGADNTLSPCPSDVDCVNTALRQPSGTRGLFARGSVAFATVIPQVREGVEALPGARVVTENDVYLHAEFRRGVFGAVDDLEVLLLPTRELVVRSASRRAGRGTPNVNRVEELRARLDRSGLLR